MGRPVKYVTVTYLAKVEKRKKKGEEVEVILV